jgi:hypothetical protein
MKKQIVIIKTYLFYTGYFRVQKHIFYTSFSNNFGKVSGKTMEGKEILKNAKTVDLRMVEGIFPGFEPMVEGLWI